MPEKETVVQVFEVNYACDTCGEPMIPTGVAFASYPPQYPHQCKNGHNKNFNHTFPYLRTVKYNGDCNCLRCHSEPV